MGFKDAQGFKVPASAPEAEQPAPNPAPAPATKPDPASHKPVQQTSDTPHYHGHRDRATDS